MLGNGALAAAPSNRKRPATNLSQASGPRHDHTVGWEAQVAAGAMAHSRLAWRVWRSRQAAHNPVPPCGLVRVREQCSQVPQGE